jgi:hypothetical protein
MLAFCGSFGRYQSNHRTIRTRITLLFLLTRQARGIPASANDKNIDKTSGKTVRYGA